jgi:hypothetical protein
MGSPQRLPERRLVELIGHSMRDGRMKRSGRNSITRRRLTALALAAVLLAGAAPAWAVPAPPGSSTTTPTVLPGVADARARLEEFKQDLDELDRELGVAAEAYNASQIELAETLEGADMTKRDLENAEIAPKGLDGVLAEILPLHVFLKLLDGGSKRGLGGQAGNRVILTWFTRE